MAGGMVMYVAGSGNEFGTLDLSDPANITYQPIGTTSTGFYGLGFTSNGNLYGLGTDALGLGTEYYQIDPTNGNTTYLGSQDFAGIGADHRSRRHDDVWIKAGNLFAFLYELTPPSTAWTGVGYTGLAGGSDGLMAFSPSGTLYTSEFNPIDNGNASDDILASVNTTTGVATLIGSGLEARFMPVVS